MESKALKTYPLPEAKTVHCTDKGLRIWHPAFTQLQVCHVDAGVVLTVSDAEGRSTLFSMTPAQRDHLVRLLSAPSSDNDLIDELGGPAKVAELLGYDKDGGVQRVHNWRVRGIPARVKLDRPDIFRPGLSATPNHQPAEVRDAA